MEKSAGRGTRDPFRRSHLCPVPALIFRKSFTDAVVRSSEHPEGAVFLLDDHVLLEGLVFFRNERLTEEAQRFALLENRGFIGIMLNFNQERLGMAAGACGYAKVCLDEAIAYARERHTFGKPLIDHEGVGFMLAENLIDLKQSELIIDWCAAVLDTGDLGVPESSMTKVAVSEALMRVADRCVQVMGGTGVSGDTIVEQVFREIRAFRIYDGPTEVHKWSLAKKIKRDWKAASA